MGSFSPAAPNRRERVARVAALGLLLTGALGGMAAARFREPVVRALPVTAGLYATLGMPVNLRGLALRDVSSRLVAEGGATFAVVEGRIVNLRESAVPVPDLRFVVRDARGLDIYRWTAKPPRDTLKPGESLAFRNRLASPPDAASEVRMDFAATARESAGRS